MTTGRAFERDATTPRSRLLKLTLAVLAALASAGALGADIYRCTVDGKTEYTDRPCKDGTFAAVVPSQSDGRPAGSTAPPSAEKVLAQHQPFTHDGFQWKVLSAQTFPALGPDSDPQASAKGTFVVVEFQLKNVSGTPRYYGEMKLLGNGTQYASSHEPYAKYQLGYDSNHSTKFEPGVTLKTFVVFDAADANEYILLVESRGGGDVRTKVRVAPVAGESALADSSNAATGASTLSASELEARERAEKAGERRFVKKGAPSATLRARLGPPDEKQYESGGQCWIYLPAPEDTETLTRICFADGVVYEVKRTIER